jgi:flagellar L-ring protein precursor FlgH
VKRSGWNRNSKLLCCAALVLCVASTANAWAAKKKDTPAQARAEYLAKLQEVANTSTSHTVGSLWQPEGELNDVSTDYKAKRVNDTLIILVAVQTTAAQNGDVNTSRAFQTSTGITGLAGNVKTSGVNPIFAGNSSTTLKGSGATDSSTTFQTSLTAQVIAVLPSGNLVVEAQRKIFMNNEHEDVIIRGVVRPNDIGPSNSVPSSSLGSLEIEMKGKGIISDSTRKVNPIARAILKLFSF